MLPAQRNRKEGLKAHWSSPWDPLLCFFISVTPAKLPINLLVGYWPTMKQVKGHPVLQTHFTGRWFSNRNRDSGARRDGRENLQRANEVIKAWICTCPSFFQALNSQQVIVPCMISGYGSASSNWIIGLFSHQNTTPGTAEASARGPWASSMVHLSILWCKTSYMRSLTPLCQGPRVFPPITAHSVSWSVKKMALMSTRSLKTWLRPGAHVAKPASNVFFSFFPLLQAE